MKIRNLAALTCAIFSLSVANSALAQGSIVAKVGTLGAGLEYVHPISPKIAVGLGINGLSYDETIEESNISYDAELNMQTFSLLGDFHPWSNGFRISAGVMSNGNEFDLVGTPSGSETVEVNGKEYNSDEVGSLTARMDFESVAPYIGIGWGHAPLSGKGWGFDADLGVLLQGEPNASLFVTCGPALSASECSTLESDAAAEEISFKSDSKEFDTLPVISLGVSYSF